MPSLRIPIYSKDYITLTRVIVRATTPPQLDMNNQLVPPVLVENPIYLNKNSIDFVEEYYDVQTQKFLNCRNIAIGPIVLQVKESYNAIKTIMDTIDCTDLCNDGGS